MKLCMLFSIQTLSRLLCASAISCVSFLDLFGPITGVTNPIKGALDNFSLIPNFFFKKVEIFISLEVYTYVVTAC